MQVSVVIVAYKNWKVLRDCLESLSQYNDIGSELEVIIVDNSPKSEKVYNKIEGNWTFEITYIESENYGFGAGNNTGAEVAKGKYLAFINPDIIFIKPIFNTVISEFESDENLVLFGGQLLKTDGSINSSFKYDFRYSFFDKQLIKIWNRFGWFDFHKMYIEGADIFIRADVFRTIGGFDENIFMYYEEADILRRIRSKNPKYWAKFVPNIQLIHLENGSTPNSDFATNIEIDSCLYFAKKYSLNAIKKLKADMRYYRFKDRVMTLFHKRSDLERQIKIYENRIMEITRREQDEK